MKRWFRKYGWLVGQSMTWSAFLSAVLLSYIAVNFGLI